MATRDVQLIIKARDEASRVFSSISGSVATLIGSQDKLATSGGGVASSMAALLAQIKTFDAAYAKISGAGDRAEASFNRQKSALAESRAQYAATATELRNLADAQQRLQTTIVDQRLAGDDTSKSVAQLQAVGAALDKQATTRARLKSSIASQEAALNTEASALQQLGSIAIATEQALAALTDEQNRQTSASKAVADAQEAATRRMSDAAKIQSQIAGATGIGGGSGKSAADSAAVLAQVNADAIAEAYEGAARRVADAAQQIQSQIAGATGIGGGSGKSAADSATVFAADFDQAAAGAERLRQRLDPLYAIQAKLNNELAEARGLYRKGALDADQLADAERRLKIEADGAAEALNRQGRGQAGKPSLFGLKPYELTNLGYQVNDVFTQLASGTSVTQTLAQQGGQILQLLPGIGAGLVKAFTNPLVLAGIAAIAGIGVVFVKASNDAQRLSRIEGILGGIADGAEHSATELAGVAEELENIGLSADESLGLVRRFLTEGLSTEYLAAFGAMAKQVADVTGEDLPDAMDSLVDAFSGGYDAVAELDDQLQFLTVSERDHIRALFDGGKASEARETAVRKLSEQLRDQKRAADDAKGGLESLTDGLDKFFDRLADTQVVQGFIKLLDELADKSGRALRIFAGEGSVEDFDTEISRLQSKLDELRKNPVTIFDGPIDFARYEYQVNLVESTLAKLRQQRSEAEAAAAKAGPKGDPVDEESAARTKRRNDRLEELRLEEQANKAKTDAQQIRIAGEAAYRDEIRKTGDAVLAATAKQIAEDKKRADLREAQAKKERDTIKLSLPVQGRITSGFGQRVHPVTGKQSFHGAIDIAAPKGRAVKAAADAVVGKVKTDPLLGKYVELDHGKGLITIYGHLSDNSQVEEGQIVKRGDTIGKVGSTGRSTGNHLHFAARQNGKPVDPRGTFKADVADAIGDAEKEMAKLAEKQDDFNAKIDEENAKRQQNIAHLENIRDLSAEAIFDAERTKEINDAVFSAEQDAQKKGIALDKQRRDLIAETVGKEYDLAKARERANAALDETTGERNGILQLLDQARELGDVGGINKLEVELAKVEEQLDRIIKKMLDVLQAQPDSASKRAQVAGLENLRNSLTIDANRRGAAAVTKPVDDLSTQRSGLMEQMSFFQEMGQTNVVEALREQLRGVNAELLTAIDASIAYFSTFGGPSAQAAIQNMENLRNQVMAAALEFQITAGQIQQIFAGSLVDATNTFVERLVETRNPLVALRDAALQFGADFLNQLGQVMLQMAALKLATKIGFGDAAKGINGLFNSGSLVAGGAALGAGGTQVQAAASSMLSSSTAWLGTAAAIQAAAAALMAANAAGGAGVLHGGGIAGFANRSRRVSPAWFAAATRYHTGGIAGLRPNEVPAILERGEEVITRNDRRHRANSANDNGSGAAGGISQVLAVGDREIASALAGAEGEKVVLTHVKRHIPTIKQMLQD